MQRALPVPYPLESILSDVDRAIDAKPYYPALLVSLTIPEICCALALSKSVFVKEKRYIGFVQNYTTEATLGLSGVDCYRLRGGVVHRANFAGHPHIGSTHVILTVPESAGAAHSVRVNRDGKIADIFDLVTFCKTMTDAARQWFFDNKDNSQVHENMKELISYSEFGLPPFFVGSPVVASGT